MPGENSVRLGFDRGSYDPYIKNYKPLPGIIFVEVTDPNAISHWGFKTFAEIQNSNGAYTLLDNKTVTFKYNGSSVWVVDQSGAPIASFNYSDLMAAWDQNARKYSKSYNANVQYFIPQSLWSGATGWRHGYVLSEYAPAYPNSGLPLDYMELYRGIGPHEIKPVAYSVPLGISCRYLGNQGSPWTWAVKELNEADFQDALADELN